MIATTVSLYCIRHSYIGGIDGIKSSVIQEHVKRGIQHSAHAGMHLRCRFR